MITTCQALSPSHWNPHFPGFRVPKQEEIVAVRFMATLPQRNHWSSKSCCSLRGLSTASAVYSSVPLPGLLLPAPQCPFSSPGLFPQATGVRSVNPAVSAYLAFTLCQTLFQALGKRTNKPLPHGTYIPVGRQTVSKCVQTVVSALQK